MSPTSNSECETSLPLLAILWKASDFIFGAIASVVAGLFLQLALYVALVDSSLIIVLKIWPHYVALCTYITMRKCIENVRIKEYNKRCGLRDLQ